MRDLFNRYLFLSRQFNKKNQTKTGLFRFEIQADRIDAVAFFGWRWTVIKNVAQMAAAVFANDFGSLHSKRIIGFQFDVFQNRVRKAGPAGFGVKFGVRRKQFGATGRANIHSAFLVAQPFSRERKFCSLFAQNIELFWRKLFAPRVFRNRFFGRHKKKVYFLVFALGLAILRVFPFFISPANSSNDSGFGSDSFFAVATRASWFSNCAFVSCNCF